MDTKTKSSPRVVRAARTFARGWVRNPEDNVEPKNCVAADRLCAALGVEPKS
jgi:hypothetical protein